MLAQSHQSNCSNIFNDIQCLVANFEKDFDYYLVCMCKCVSLLLILGIIAVRFWNQKEDSDLLGVVLLVLRENE